MCVFIDITAVDSEVRLAKVEAESSAEKCGTHEVVLFTAV
jgi:hypothetical protein